MKERKRCVLCMYLCDAEVKKETAMCRFDECVFVCLCLRIRIVGDNGLVVLN